METAFLQGANANGVLDSFLRSLLVIVVTEIGDKTFFIAAILTMKYGRLVVYAGAMSALAVMHLLSSFMGFTLPTLIPRFYTHYISAALFVYFGFKLLWDARGMSDEPSSELLEVEEEMNKKDGPEDVEDGEGSRARQDKDNESLKIFTQTFTLTFLAEWGDRSQIATIALAAHKDLTGVVLGGLLGHALCTGLAVVGGKMLASRISERQVSIVGGILFLVFAAHSFYVGPEV
jgi:putative Ca2+/H+ antiporter (TMEM165/GDT1 family)